MSNTASDDFSRNLRLLCSYCHSVSEVCRQLEINRQQFARYLSGESQPASRNIRKICDYFGVEEAEIYLPHRKFSEMIVVKPTKDMKSSVNIIDELDLSIQAASSFARKYLGYYYRYLRSIEYRDTIIKAAVRLYEEDGKIKSKAIELLRRRDQPDDAYDRFKYRGVFLSMADRLFLVETDYILKNAITETVLFPSHKNPLTLLFGKALGVSSGPPREPYVTPIVYEYVGLKPNLRDLLGNLALYPEDSEDIDAKVRDYLLNETL